MRRLVPVRPAARRRAALFLAFGLAAAAAAAAAPPAPAPAPDEARLRAMTARFAPVDIGADVSRLPDGERRALAKLVEAARVDGRALPAPGVGRERAAAARAARRRARPLGRERLYAFLLNKGPWSRLDHDAPFVPGVPAKPEAANFYPAGATKAEVEAWMKGAARRGAPGGAGLLHHDPPRRRRAARRRALQRRVPGRARPRGGAAARGRGARPRSRPCKRFLETRAAAFLSNDYYESDVAWMELDASIEPTIGPYEIYEDELVRLQGGVRGVRHRARRRGDGEAREARRGAAGPRERAADRPRAAQPEARRPRADPRRERRLLARGTATAACRPPPTTCRTTSGSCPRRAASA